MPNNTNRRNQPPSGAGKNQPRRVGDAKRMNDRSEVVQAQRNHPELNVGKDDQPVGRGTVASARARRKAGR